MKKRMQFDQFRHIIAEELGIDPVLLTPHASFLTDLAIDSLSMVNFIVKIEKMYGIRIDLESVWSMKTVADAYEVFTKKLLEQNTAQG